MRVLRGYNMLGVGIAIALIFGFFFEASAAGASAPSYTPLFTATFDSGTLGSSISEFATPTTPAKLLYSNQVGGPFGGGLVARQENQSTKKFFGGKIVDVNLGAGNEIWVRWYEYFPPGFCFANGTNGDGNGGAGKVKWIRFQYGATSERITFELDAQPSCTAPCNACLNTIRPDSIVGELQDWKQRYGNIKIGMPSSSFSLGQWHALQVYMRLSTGSSNKGDGNGLIRVWIDNQMVGEYQHNTMPITGSKLKSIWWGNYWNGGFPKDQHWYLDEVIVTTNLPNTLDSGGRRFISPQTRVSDFAGTGGSGGTGGSNVKPNPPVLLPIQ